MARFDAVEGIRQGLRGLGYGRDRETDDTSGGLAPTYSCEEATMLKKAKSRANLIVASSVGIYREMTLSAASLFRR